MPFVNIPPFTVAELIGADDGQGSVAARTPDDAQKFADGMTRDWLQNFRMGERSVLSRSGR